MRLPADICGSSSSYGVLRAEFSVHGKRWSRNRDGHYDWESAMQEFLTHHQRGPFSAFWISLWRPKFSHITSESGEVPSKPGGWHGTGRISASRPDLRAALNSAVGAYGIWERHIVVAGFDPPPRRLPSETFQCLSCHNQTENLPLHTESLGAI